jgi:signal transduction histidine kinase
MAVQTALIVGLLVQRTRRRRAESDLRASFDRVREIGGRLLSAQETERTRIARELHDDISQQLALLRLNLSRLTRLVQGHAGIVAGEAVKCADGIVTSVHDLSHRLYPARLRLIGLVPALDALLGEFSRRGPGITFTHENVPTALSPDLTLCLFRVVQEALQNALKHSHAQNVSIHLSGTADGVMLTVIDDGVGFAVDAGWGRGLGLISMSERVDAIGGTFNVRSSPHRGTRIEVSVPVAIANDAGAIAI